MKCECGGNRFYASQRIVTGIIVDEKGNFMCDDIDAEVTAWERPFGPYECVKCGKEYETIEG